MKKIKAARNASPATTVSTVETIGHAAGKIQVELSTRFLQHFSEQLYSSPQKAFEELISNGWDAGANRVDVRVSDNLSDQNATMTVLDNGASMDAEGLRQLWHIAFSPKTETPLQYGRRVIGKFGIGKLATYVLAKKLTYICKAADGKIRRVTMNYGDVDKAGVADRLISEMDLEIFEVEPGELESALKSVYAGKQTLKLLQDGFPSPKELTDDEFGAEKSTLNPPASGTWTLVVLSDLKQTGRALKLGVLRRMLAAALPINSEMAISVNGELLASSKIDTPIMKQWVIGPELGIDSLEIDEESDEAGSIGSSANKSGQPGTANPTKVPVKSGFNPVSFVELPGIGKVTGRVTLFEEFISGGKSDERGASNGFHVNVLGRVVNLSDPSFGEQNLSHAAWARFRMTVRADGLNQFLTTDREKLRESRELKVFRAFLRRAFNKTRSLYDADEGTAMPHGGDELVKSLGVLSLNPLRNVVSETLRKQAPLPGMFDETGIPDRAEKRKSWRENTAENIRNALGQVKYDRFDDGSLVKFRISDNSILINKEHPFVMEHSRTKAEKELMRTVAMVNLLSDVYALDIGVAPTALQNIRDYRDRLLRFRAMQQRQSGTYIARLLLQTQHDSEHNKRLEAAVSDALSYLGFQVQDMAKPGEPEGVASAYATPTNANPTKEDPHPPLYSFSFDAKSSKHENAATGNIKLDGVVQHRKACKANYALIIAPGFSGPSIVTRCEQQQVTPIKARDLGRLLEFTVEYGAIPVTKLRELFSFYNADLVSGWVDCLEKWLQEKRPLTIDIFLKALQNLKGKVPDVLPAAIIAYECRQHLNAPTVKDEHVVALVRGLSILIPDIVGIDEDKIVINASAERVAAAIESQLERLHEDKP